MDGDWVKDPGFVLFFAEMQQRAFDREAGPFVDWTRLPEAETGQAVVALTPYLGAAALGLLLGAMAWFMRRAR